MKYAIKQGAALSILMLAASCGSFDGKKDKGLGELPAAPQTPMTQGVSDTPVRLGSPFVVGNVTYTPSDPVSYDEVGYASYYGSELAGRPTANGEAFMPTAITAAHKTLPMPSYVEVTSLDTGRTIVVRVNDRGPFANDRLIDLSEGAARQLGIAPQGVAGVRVRRVNPPEQEKAVLRSGGQPQPRIDTPESLLKVLRDKLAKAPKPAGVTYQPTKAPSGSSGPASSGDDRFIREGNGASSKPKPIATKPSSPAPIREVVVTADGGGYVVQLASFSSRSHAEQLAKKAGAKVVPSPDGKLFRVRYGPFATSEEAVRKAAEAKQRGYSSATAMRN